MCRPGRGCKEEGGREGRLGARSEAAGRTTSWRGGLMGTRTGGREQRGAHVAGPCGWPHARVRRADSALEAVGNHPRGLHMPRLNEGSFQKGSGLPGNGEPKFPGSVSKM